MVQFTPTPGSTPGSIQPHANTRPATNSAASPDHSVATAKTSNPITKTVSVNNVSLQNTERQDPLTTANKILDFVNTGIEQLRSSGASDERMEARLEAARQGIEKGYQQATGMLSSMGLLDDQLKGDIAASRSLVDGRLSSLDHLADTFIHPSTSPSTSTPKNQQQSSFSQSNRLALEVQTRDGDKVTVFFAQHTAINESSSAGRYGVSASQDQQFNFSVDGQLDDGEMAALSGLLEQVGSLSQQFFAGDLGTALKEAMALGYNQQELASFSLDLRQGFTLQTTLTQRTQQYQPAAAEAPTTAIEQLKAPLANYVDHYLATLDAANPIASAAQLLDTLVANLVANRLAADDSRITAFRDFNQGIRDVLAARMT